MLTFVLLLADLAIELPTVVGHKQKRELAVYLGLVAIGLVLSVFISLGWFPPLIAEWLETLFGGGININTH
jgi:hypothetical protein